MKLILHIQLLFVVTSLAASVAERSYTENFIA